MPGPTTAPPGLFFCPRPPQGRCTRRAVTARSSAPRPRWWKRRAEAKPNPQNTPKKSLTHRETGPKAEPGLLLPAKARLGRARWDEHQKIKGAHGETLGTTGSSCPWGALCTHRAITAPHGQPKHTGRTPWGQIGWKHPRSKHWGLLERAPQPQCETPRRPFAPSPR